MKKKNEKRMKKKNEKRKKSTIYAMKFAFGMSKL